MERLTFEVGRTVQSTQGRDQGRCFVILSVVDESYVLMADGLTRRSEHPKRKKVKHLHPKPYVFEAAKGAVASVLFDSKLRKFLDAQGLTVKTSPKTESRSSEDRPDVGSTNEASDPKEG